MAEERKKQFCLICGEPLMAVEQLHCQVCHWETEIQRIESEIASVRSSPVERRIRIKQQQDSIAELERILTAWKEQCLAKRVWWEKILGLHAEDHRIKRLNSDLEEARSQLETMKRLFERDSEKFLRSAKRRLTTAEFELGRAQEKRHERQRRNEQQLEEQLEFAQNSHNSLQKSFESCQFRIRDRDFQQGNLLDKYFWKDFRWAVLTAFENRCVRCLKRSGLVLDHFGVPKREGGNFIMCLEHDHSLKPNVIVLCHGCRALRGQESYLDFFTVRELKRIFSAQALLLEQILRDLEALTLIRKWYRRPSSQPQPEGDRWPAIKPTSPELASHPEPGDLM